MSNVKLKTVSNGSVTLSPQDTASDVVVTVPATTGVVNTSGVVNQVPAGSASAPSVYPTGDANTGLFFPAADTVAVATGGAERYRVDSSGNLLVGTTTAPAKFTVAGSGRFTTTSGDTLSITSGNGSGSGIVYSSGTNTGTVGYFMVTSGGINVESGKILVSTSGTVYATSSDYRLKENVQPMQNALATVAQLKPCTYTWKVDGSAGQGFIAHELQAVVPDCVTGEKDAVRIVDVLDDESKKIGTKEEPVYQGVDTSFLVATLTAAIQEQQAMIQTLQAEVADLKSKVQA